MARWPFFGPGVEGLREEVGGGLRGLTTPCAIFGRGGYGDGDGDGVRREGGGGGCGGGGWG